ncbi:MAG: NADH-quinone oxidoreductase subunit L [Chloroflexota bacterium]
MHDIILDPTATATGYWSVALVPLLPLIGFLITGLLGSRIKSEKAVGSIASAVVGGSFIVALYLFFKLAGSGVERPIIVPVYEWITAGNFSAGVSYQVDQLSLLFTLIITGVGFLIHVYSIGYMHGDRAFSRFFAYLNLFIFMMLTLVLASNFLLTFLGWEGVGLCSYLLIGFWYDRNFPGVRITYTGDAANKAFIVNRIGDFGFLVAMFMIFLNFGTLNYVDFNNALALNSTVFFGGGLVTAIALLLFLGCTGKSAQIPLAVWLPDAMAGPTPVSALIHAATMVTAGIFLIARNSTLFALSPDAMAVVAVVGTATALLAATVGLVQNDIKKVLAYSTVSQLGFMFAALGVGAYTAAIFHVMTHAFFKGLLFLGSGSVIHGMHEEQDITKMGGLGKYMPTTYKTFYVGALAISGIPLFSGFFSKDEILWNAWQGTPLMWIVLALAAFCTAFYMFRLVNLTFKGEERFDSHKVHPHESPKTMTIPLIVLAVLSALGGFLGIPYALGFFLSDHPNLLENWLHPVFADAARILGNHGPHEIHSIEYVLMLVSTGIAIFGIYLANKWYSSREWTIPNRLSERFAPFYRLLMDKYRLDEFYFKAIVDPVVGFSKVFLWKTFDEKMIDGVVNGAAKGTGRAAESVRKLQSGVVQNYALLMVLGIVVILFYLILK